MKVLAPLYEDAPRMCPVRALPPYRHVPGLTPHPVNDLRGHSYGGDALLGFGPPWESCEAFLYGIDLYHQGYLWESHEAWEPLWRALGRSSMEGCVVQALIRNSAALLKAHLENWRGTDRHSRAAFALLGTVLAQRGAGCRILRMDVMDFMDAMERCYGELWRGHYELGPPPRIVLR
ncbi:MAG: hypothetical protein AMXMBFR82_39640 [Candidatus Hydrogenedentota bacterium]